MLHDVRFLSLAAARARRPNRRTVVVSITDRAGARLRPDFSGYRDVLQLEFVDVSEEFSGERPGSWPLEPSPQQCAALSGLHDEQVPSLSHARRLLSFLSEHHQTTTQVRVLVHCHAGASRSAAVAAWVSRHFGVPLRDPLRRGLEDANPRVHRVLQAAAS